MTNTTDRIETTQIDLNRDGVMDETRLVTYQFAGDKLVTRTESVTNTLYGSARNEQVDFGHDGSGNVVFERRLNDWDGDWTFDYETTVDRTFDGGRLMTETISSQDMNGDGIAGDYQAVTTFSYNVSGQITQKHTSNISYGYTNPGDYRTETWTYDNAGRQTSYSIDDPINFDCVITDTSSASIHNRAGQLRKVTQQNEIRFGDDCARVTETFSYNKDGSQKEHTTWGEYTEYGYAKWVQEQYIVATPGYDKTKKLFDLDGDFKPEFRTTTETWRNEFGQETDTLVRNYQGNTLTSTDKFTKIWDGDVLAYEAHDFGADGINEYVFSSELLVA